MTDITKLYKEERDEFEAEAIRLRALNAELVAALDAMTCDERWIIYEGQVYMPISEATFEQARAVLAKAKGE